MSMSSSEKQSSESDCRPHKTAVYEKADMHQFYDFSLSDTKQDIVGDSWFDKHEESFCVSSCEEEPAKEDVEETKTEETAAVVNDIQAKLNIVVQPVKPVLMAVENRPPKPPLLGKPPIMPRKPAVFKEMAIKKPPVHQSQHHHQPLKVNHAVSIGPLAQLVQPAPPAKASEVDRGRATTRRSGIPGGGHTAERVRRRSESRGPRTPLDHEQQKDAGRSTPLNFTDSLRRYQPSPPIKLRSRQHSQEQPTARPASVASNTSDGKAAPKNEWAAKLKVGYTYGVPVPTKRRAPTVPRPFHFATDDRLLAAQKLNRDKPATEKAANSEKE